MIRPFLWVSLALLFSSTLTSLSQAQFRELTKRIPDGANTIVFIDVNKLQNSPLGKSENWRAKQEKSFEAGLEMVPPQALEFVAAAKLDLASKQADWQVGLMKLAYDPSMAKVAVRYQGTTDMIANRSVAVIPGDIYIVKFLENIIGYGMPANRQDAAQWINRYYDNSLRGLSPYLSEAETFADNGSPIIVALDLTHAVSAGQIRPRLNEMESLKGKDIDLDKLAEALASIRGISLGVTVNQNMVGAVKVDFASDISLLGDAAKPLLLEVLGRQGMMIDEVRDWKPSINGKTIQLTGTLYPSGLRRILSLVETPPSLQEAVAKTKGDPQEAETQSEKDLTIAASKLYYTSVVSLLDELRSDKKHRTTLGQISVWFDKYARRIDRLPIANVDPELLAYGKYVSDTLRGGSTDVTDAAARKRVRSQQVPEQYDISTYSTPIGVTDWSGGYSWNGWSATPDWERTAKLQSQVRTEENIKGARSANVVISELDGATADIRRKMTQKYGVEF
ncbi:hypothetical protein DTL21_03010 [Bremerella cremea]|uniref:DUF1598 domain-containing protein n=1 Tax=Blastopirellula marina TaxID=124 RepID=A0A2S8G5P7_9BACT|nr:MULTISPECIES: hypothetical protein [Pirellulaceae]PQO39733.1 hypothetical protein C5Y83_03010 [Blastopirellula marina]RCS51200.1 hypothetical protein DTL21_03010 [Bremerella cremea]